MRAVDKTLDQALDMLQRLSAHSSDHLSILGQNDYQVRYRRGVFELFEGRANSHFVGSGDKQMIKDAVALDLDPQMLDEIVIKVADTTLFLWDGGEPLTMYGSGQGVNLNNLHTGVNMRLAGGVPRNRQRESHALRFIGAPRLSNNNAPYPVRSASQLQRNMSRAIRMESNRARRRNVAYMNEINARLLNNNNTPIPGHSFNNYREMYFNEQRKKGEIKKRNLPLNKWLAAQNVNKPLNGNRNLKINAGDLVNVMTQNLPKNASKALYIVNNVSKGKIHGVYDPETLYELVVAGNGRSPVSREPVKRVKRVPPQIAAKIVAASRRTTSMRSRRAGNNAVPKKNQLKKWQKTLG